MGHRQSCLSVTQAVSYDPQGIHAARRWSRFSGSIQALALPFSTQIPNRAVEHTFVQPSDCLMPNPRPGDANRVSGTSGWIEGVSAPPLCLLVPVPGCFLGSEPATCLRTPPAGREFTPASTSETGRKSPAGPETLLLTLFVPVGPCTLTVSDHELCAYASCMGVTVQRACTAPATQAASGQGDEQTEAGADPTHATPAD